MDNKILMIVSDAYFYKSTDGKYYAAAIYEYDFWKRYLDVFHKVRVVARVEPVKKLNCKWKRADGDFVEFFDIPHFRGPKQLAKVLFKVMHLLKKAYKGCDAAIYRLPSPTAQLAWLQMGRRKVPTALEIVYDCIDDLHNAEMGFVYKFFAVVNVIMLKFICKKANGVSYVTERTIQKHFPSKASIYGESRLYFESNYSSVELKESFYQGVRQFDGQKKFTLAISDVSMNTERKGEKVLFYCVKKLIEKGYDVRALVIGDGTLRKKYEDYCENIGIREYVQFTGLLSSSEEVANTLKKADIYVFPSKGEGLPRGIIEAMSFGMPVLSTFAGGIPEIIDSRYLFAPDDKAGFLNMLCHLFDHTEELNQMSYDNYNKAFEFRSDVLQARRNLFYKRLKNIT